MFAYKISLSYFVVIKLPIVKYPSIMLFLCDSLVFIL